MPTSPIRAPDGCVDPDIGNLLWQYGGQLQELSCRERVLVLTHSNRCRACLKLALDRHEAYLAERQADPSDPELNLAGPP